jgi:hypothetical protein
LDSLGGIVRMKVLFIILILVEIFLAILVITPPLVDRHDLASAVLAYSQDQSQDNLKELQLQQDITSQIEFRMMLTVALLLVVNSCGLFLVGRRLRRIRAAA